MRVRWGDQRGAAMVMTAIYLSTLLLFIGLALDYGRAHLLRAQLQTALDAATLAGALQSDSWVEITVLRRQWYKVTDWCWDPDNGDYYRCGSHWEYRNADVCCIKGLEQDLLPAGWRGRVDCNWTYDCLGPRVDRAWLVMRDSAYDWARDAFARNATWPQGSGGVALREFWVGPDPGGQTRLAGKAVVALPTSFLRLAGITEIPVSRTAAAEPVRRPTRR